MPGIHPAVLELERTGRTTVPMSRETVAVAVLLPDRIAIDRLAARLSRAHGVLLLHVAGLAGFCAGCLDTARLAPVPCPSARQALSIVETQGVSTWDVPPLDDSTAPMGQEARIDALLVHACGRRHPADGEIGGSRTCRPAGHEEIR